MSGAEASFVIERLDPARHDRSTFASGIPQVDNFFRRTANKLTKTDQLRTYVMTDAGEALIGFYAVNAHSIEYTALPDQFARRRASHGMIPAAFIAMIGVDRRFQGCGHGGVLLIDCLQRLAGAAETLGIAVVLLDILDCGDAVQIGRRRALYESYGFQSLPSNPMRMFIAMATIRSLIVTS